MQQDIIGGALDLLENAWASRTTIQRPEIWDSEDDDFWRERYMRVSDSNRDALAAVGDKRRTAKRAAGK